MTTETTAPPADEIVMPAQRQRTDETETGDSPDDPIVTGEYAAGGGSGLAIEMARNGFAEDLSKAEEGVFRYGYDQASAWAEITSLNEEVTSCKSQWDRDKATAAASKKEYDEAVATLSLRIRTLESERQKPALPLSGATSLGGAAAGDGICQYERTTGVHCAVCRGTIIDQTIILDEGKQATDPTHEVVAERYSLERLSTLLTSRNVFLDADELKTLTTDDLRSLAAWSSLTNPTLPADVLVKRSHMAAAAGDEVQCCAACGTALMDQTNLPGGAYQTRAAWYPKQSLIGLDCPGTLQGDSAAPEPARIMPMRGRKDRRRKAEPERVRADQRAAAETQVDDDAGASDTTASE